MSDFVLIHGAMMGSMWGPLSDELRKLNHRVFVPELTGCGSRAHLLTPEIDIDVHIKDVLGVLTYEDLSNVTMVGHSYGGVVASMVAEHAKERIGRTVFIDAVFPEDGQSGFDTLPPEAVGLFTEQVKTNGDGWRLPVIPALIEMWAIENPEHKEYITKRLCDFPWKCFCQPAKLPTNAVSSLPGAYIRGVRPTPTTDFTIPFAEKAKALGWPVYEVNSGHQLQVEAAEELAGILSELAGKS